MAGSLAALVASIHIARYIKKFHTYRFTASIALAEVISVAVFGYTSNIYFLVFFFIAHFVLQTLLYICLNVFIESFSKHAETGSIRGLFLALLNTGILVSPVIGGTILSHYSFFVLYFVAALMLIPFIILLNHYLAHIKEPAYHTIDTFKAFRVAWRNKNLRAVLISSFIIHCFYATMIIYSPIYLQSLGIPLSTYLAIILPFALLPLVLLPYELGYLADSQFGEKEILLGGLLLLAITVFLFVILTSSDPIVWIIVLVFSRIGAACVETMAFTYYYKKINPEDASLTALFSNTLPVATIVVGALGAIISPFLHEKPQLIFVILGCAILWSISYVLPMKDTR
jgi:predicted MFS family arabinose efflux permease